MSVSAPRETYQEWLARKMDEGGHTLRGLAKKWNPENPEVARRALRRYLKGVVPISRTRLEIARILGSDDSEPSSDADDTEDD